MEVQHARCCGIDIHKRSITACVLIRESGRREQVHTRVRDHNIRNSELRRLVANVGSDACGHAIVGRAFCEYAYS
jgi:hypothetical protein